MFQSFNRMFSKERLHEIIFEADTHAGKAFDIGILILIIISVISVIAESVGWVSIKYQQELRLIEWFCTVIFTIEYIVRLYCVTHPLKYAGSFFGIIDLLAVLPAYLYFFIPGLHQLVVIRMLRLLRIFRVLKLSRYVGESQTLMTALLASRRKIGIFLFAVFNLVVILGTLMHVIEGEEHGFTDIPTSMYWAIVTLTTVGYGDLTPVTPFGRFIASFVMVIGYGIIAVPTGIVSVELNKAVNEITTKACSYCGKHLQSFDSKFCSYCGKKSQPN